MATVPSGSVTTTTYVGIHRMDLTGLPAGRKTLSPVYEISPGIALNPMHPARLSIRISDPNALPLANIYWWNPSVPGYWVGRWQMITAGKSIGPNNIESMDPNNTISVDIDRCGYFVVIESEQGGFTSQGLIVIAISLILAGGYLILRQRRNRLSLK